MKKKVVVYIKVIFIVLLVGVTFFYFRFSSKKTPSSQPRTYEQLIDDDTLRVVTEYNSIAFFGEKDTIRGFHYELINAFAKDRGLELKISPQMSFEKQYEGLNKGRYDLIASGITVTSPLKDSLLLTSPIIINKQILVQRKENYDTITPYITNQLELAKKLLYVVKGSSSVLRIKNIEKEIGDTIHVREIDKYGTEQLLALVAHGDIDYAVCREDLVKQYIDSFPQLDIKTSISFNQFYGWALQKDNVQLRDTINLWLKQFMKTHKFERIYQRYYKK